MQDVSPTMRRIDRAVTGGRSIREMSGGMFNPRSLSGRDAATVLPVSRRTSPLWESSATSVRNKEDGVKVDRRSVQPFRDRPPKELWLTNYMSLNGDSISSLPGQAEAGYDGVASSQRTTRSSRGQSTAMRNCSPNRLDVTVGRSTSPQTLRSPYNDPWEGNRGAEPTPSSTRSNDTSHSRDRGCPVSNNRTPRRGGRWAPNAGDNQGEHFLSYASASTQQQHQPQHSERQQCAGRGVSDVRGFSPVQRHTVRYPMQNSPDEQPETPSFSFFSRRHSGDGQGFSVTTPPHGVNSRYLESDTRLGALPTSSDGTCRVLTSLVLPVATGHATSSSSPSGPRDYGALRFGKGKQASSIASDALTESTHSSERTQSRDLSASGEDIGSSAPDTAGQPGDENLLVNISITYPPDGDRLPSISELAFRLFCLSTDCPICIGKLGCIGSSLLASRDQIRSSSGALPKDEEGDKRLDDHNEETKFNRRHSRSTPHLQIRNSAILRSSKNERVSDKLGSDQKCSSSLVVSVLGDSWGSIPDVAATPCGHLFCRPCLMNVLESATLEKMASGSLKLSKKFKCPICRTKLRAYDVKRIVFF